ncbi:MAG: ribA/ribD-fused uncharacterized protein [Planctomycetota bacterium]|jgi:ribA/ribD-fused uncharacterized protein
MPDTIYFYSKNELYYELSNFFPQGFEKDGDYWPTAEHYFQAQKFAGDDWVAYREKVRTCGPPKNAKNLGQTRQSSLR